MSSGFGAEDDYSLYDKPLFSGSSAAAIYRPKRSEEASLGGVSADRIEKIVGGGKPHKGFKGAESTAASDAPRDGPVQFEKEVDPFGFSEFMGSAKRGRDGEGGEQGESSKKSRA
jgi:SNW domain-containing protein 1